MQRLSNMCAAQDTLIWDPFYTEVPHFFDMKFQDLLAAKDAQAWPRFERGEISEEELIRDFFKDRRPVNGSGLINHMARLLPLARPQRRAAPLPQLCPA